MKKILFLLSIIFFIQGCTVFAVDGKALLVNDDVWRLMESEDYNSALELINKEIGDNDSDCRLYNTRALIKSDLKDFEGAEEDFAISIKLRPDYPTAYFNRGEMYYLKSPNWVLALSDFNMAIKLGYPSPWSYLNRGYIKLSLNDVSGALKDFNVVVNDEVKNRIPENNFFDINHQLGINYKAVNVHNEKDYGDTEITAYIGAAECYYRMNEYDKVIDMANSSISISERNNFLNPRAYELRGLAKIFTSEVYEGILDLKISKEHYVAQYDRESLYRLDNMIKYYSEHY